MSIFPLASILTSSSVAKHGDAPVMSLESISLVVDNARSPACPISFEVKYRVPPPPPPTTPCTPEVPSSPPPLIGVFASPRLRRGSRGKNHPNRNLASSSNMNQNNRWCSSSNTSPPLLVPINASPRVSSNKNARKTNYKRSISSDCIITETIESAMDILTIDQQNEERWVSHTMITPPQPSTNRKKAFRRSGSCDGIESLLMKTAERRRGSPRRRYSCGSNRNDRWSSSSPSNSRKEPPPLIHANRSPYILGRKPINDDDNGGGKSSGSSSRRAGRTNPARANTVTSSPQYAVRMPVRKSSKEPPSKALLRSSSSSSPLRIPIRQQSLRSVHHQNNTEKEKEPISSLKVDAKTDVSPVPNNKDLQLSPLKMPAVQNNSLNQILNHKLLRNSAA